MRFSAFIGFLGLGLLGISLPTRADEYECLKLTIDLPQDGAYEANLVDNADQFVPGSVNGADLAPDGFPQKIRVCAEFCDEEDTNPADGIADLSAIAVDPAHQAEISFMFISPNEAPWYPSPSKVTGVAMNYPPRDESNGNSDITFKGGALSAKEKVSLLENVSPKRAIACTDMEVNDYGATSYINASTQVEKKGEEQDVTITVYLSDSDTVPRDKDYNMVSDADAFNGNCGSGLQGAKKDDDDQPSDSGKSGDVGDGLSCYEERRGFVLWDGKHYRTDPGRKDFFVANTTVGGGGNIAKTGLEVRQVRLSQIDGSGSRVVNFHNFSLAHVVDQHGVWVRQMPLANDYGYTLKYCTPPDCTPGDVQYILIDRNGIMKETGYKPYDPKAQYTRVLSHELGHSIGVPHHADTGDDEDPAIQGGRFSGDQGCFMRYSIQANDYTGVDGEIYEYFHFVSSTGADGKPSGYYDVSEETIAGTEICSSKTGTGTNAQGAKPSDPSDTRVFPKAGNATNGDCKHAWKVSDKK